MTTWLEALVSGKFESVAKKDKLEEFSRKLADLCEKEGIGLTAFLVDKGNSNHINEDVAVCAHLVTEEQILRASEMFEELYNKRLRLLTDHRLN